MPRAVDDDLLALERRVEVRDDAHRPPLGALRQPQRLGRRAVLAAEAERARVELFSRRGLERRAAGAGPAGAAGRDDDGAARLRVVQQAAAQPAPVRSCMNGVSRSIGAGNTIVVACDEPSSSSVWR